MPDQAQFCRSRVYVKLSCFLNRSREYLTRYAREISKCQAGFCIHNVFSVRITFLLVKIQILLYESCDFCIEHVFYAIAYAKITYYFCKNRGVSVYIKRFLYISSDFCIYQAISVQMTSFLQRSRVLPGYPGTPVWQHSVSQSHSQTKPTLQLLSRTLKHKQLNIKI